MKYFQTLKKEENMINMVKKAFKNKAVAMVMICQIFFQAFLEEEVKDLKKDKKDRI